MDARWKQVLACSAAVATVAVGGAVTASAATPNVSVSPKAISTIQQYLDSESVSSTTGQ